MRSEFTFKYGHVHEVLHLYLLTHDLADSPQHPQATKKNFNSTGFDIHSLCVYVSSSAHPKLFVE